MILWLKNEDDQLRSLLSLIMCEPEWARSSKVMLTIGRESERLSNTGESTGLSISQVILWEFSLTGLKFTDHRKCLD